MVDVAERGRAGVRLAVVSVVAMAAAVAGLATLSYAREPAQSGTDCYRDDFGGRRGAIEGFDQSDLQGIYTRCRALAGSVTRPRRETLYANFFAGKAARRLGELRGEPQASQLWKDAEAALRDVADFNGPRAADRSTPADLKFELTRIESTVELAQVLSRQARTDEAVRRAREGIGLYAAYGANPQYTAFKNEAAAQRVTASFVLSDIYQSQKPADEVSSMDALRVFTDKNLDGHPKAAEARARIVEVGGRLGAAELAIGSPEALRRAQDYFLRAAEAGEAARRLDPTFPISATYVSLGKVNMGAAQLSGPDTPRGCDRRVTDTDRIEAALKLFQRADDTAEGQRWAGCAQLALGDLSGAVRSFRQAAAYNSNTADAQLSLARALYREAITPGTLDPAGSWREARTSFESALALMESNPTQRADAATKAKVRVELADVDLAYLEWPNLPASEKPRVVNHALANLRAAVALAPTQSDAFLRLGMIQLGEGDFAREIDLDGAGANLAKALQYARENIALRAEAYYLLSRLEVRKVQAGRGKPSRTEAIRNADRASELGDEQRGPVYFAQSCEARLVFGFTDAAGTQYCVANETRDGANYALALLHEGMYFLSKAKTARNGTEQSSDWEYALLAFSKGERFLQERGLGADWSQLRSRLVTGRGLSLGCSGLRQLGLDAINSVPVNLAVEAREYFDRYGVKVCAAAKR